MELSISLLEVGLDRSVRKVEFGGGIEVILQQSRVYSTAEQSIFTICSTLCSLPSKNNDCNTCACALCTAHAQYIIMVKGGGSKKVMRALMRN